MSSWEKNTRKCKCKSTHSHCSDSCCCPGSGPTFSFSEPVATFLPSPLLTVTNTETQITTVTINTREKSLIELRGLVGWSAPQSFNVLTFWRIRRGVGGPIIWEGHDGIGVDTGELRGYLSSILHVDNTRAGLSANTYILTAQVDPVTSPGRIANINGPIVFNATAYPL